MSRSRDYKNEMYANPELDDATVEAVLSGDPVSAELEPLAAALGALRALPGQPVRPSKELAARMATGDFASAVAPRPSRRSAGRHVARRRVAALPLRAKIAAGSVLALGGLASATVAGALPDQAQQSVESVIETITPFEFNESDDFGREVSEDARDGGVDGQEVSEKAKDQGDQPEDAGDSGLAPDGSQDPAEDPGGDRQDASTTRPVDVGAKQPDPSRPADKGKPDEVGNPSSADRRAETPAEPGSTD
ncbi:MAG TPA: hypothetical protein VFY84_11470 [Jiangellales bacterium]|nr:hypothetical protein [Jiangellales bacterium]